MFSSQKGPQPKMLTQPSKISPEADFGDFSKSLQKERTAIFSEILCRIHPSKLQTEPRGEKLIFRIFPAKKHGSMGPWDHGTMGPWDHGTMGPWDHGTMGPWGHGTMGPWVHGTRDQGPGTGTGTRDRGPGTGTRDQGPGPGTRDRGPRTRDQGPGTRDQRPRGGQKDAWEAALGTPGSQPGQRGFWRQNKQIS